MALAEELDGLMNQIVLKAENQLELLIGQCKSEVKLTNTQEHILMLLAEERLTNTDLAKRLNVSQAAITKAVKSLVAKEMLTSVKDTEDARVSYFTLTAEAEPIAREHSHHHEDTLHAYDGVINQFSSEEQTVIARFIQTLSQELERQE
ncbi:zinc-dependent MarR family transcriptional regulator [Streptococcus caprae]|uniref:Zinc-dependent MarR family transcriptional regulator n=1 Tax=Streptococcus caprae TaxID=1640501 RepID=A0ABV8CX99_9STRE